MSKYTGAAVKAMREYQLASARAEVEQRSFMAANRGVGNAALGALTIHRTCEYCRSPHSATSCPNCGGPA